MWTAGAEANIGTHAKTRWEDLLRFGGGPQRPVAPSKEPDINKAARRPKVQVLQDDGQIREEYVYLMKETDEAPSAPPPDHCYRRIPRKKTVRVQFGHLIYAIQLDRIPTKTTPKIPPSSPGGAPQFPPVYHVDNNRYHMVAIKKQNKQQILDYLRRGGHENPFVNILRMQQLGDNIHVLKCLEALHDDKYLYTVMPLCRTRSIMESLENAASNDDDIMEDGDPVEAHARKLFRVLLENLHYLHSFNICHHDLSPDNILETHEGRLVLVDLAMSLEMPMSDASGQVRHRTVILPNGVYGKPPYMSPEVFMNHTPFDGCYLDVWAAGCILYNLLTQKLVCQQPHPTDILFKYFIMAQGLSNEPMNERTVEVLIDLYQATDHAGVEDQQSLLDRAMVHLNFSPRVMELLAGILHWNPLERWTLADVMQCDWVQNNNNDFDGGDEGDGGFFF